MDKEWKIGKFDPPKIHFAINENSHEKYIVISDKSTVFKLINRLGQIYMVAAFRCDAKSGKNGEFYSCKEPLHLVNCSKLEDPRDIFARDTLVKKYLI